MNRKVSQGLICKILMLSTINDIISTGTSKKDNTFSDSNSVYTLNEPVVMDDSVDELDSMNDPNPQITKPNVIVPIFFMNEPQNKLDLNDLESIRDMIGKVSISLFVDLPLTLVSLVVLFLINKTLFIIGVFMLVIYFIIIFVFRTSFNDYIKLISMTNLL